MRTRFNMKSFIGMENEIGQRLELCNPCPCPEPANNEIDYSLGVAKKQTKYKAEELQGYAVKEKVSQIAVSGSQVSKAMEYHAYINGCQFSPDMVNDQSLLGVNGRYYQMEMIDPIYSRGTIMYYVYRLKETDRTQANILITERQKITRWYHK